jgi:hypothetical protein
VTFYFVWLRDDPALGPRPAPWLVKIQIDGWNDWTVGTNGVAGKLSALAGGTGDVTTIESYHNGQFPEIYPVHEILRRGLDVTTSIRFTSQTPPISWKRQHFLQSTIVLLI